MTRSFRSRLTLAASLVAVLAAGAVVAAQAFAGSSSSTAMTPSAEATSADGAAVTMHNWTETGTRHGSIIHP
jgi:hypothetical protein